MDKKIVFFVALVTTLCLPAFGFYSYYVSYYYEREVGSYIENAYEVNTPERMMEQVKRAEEGMRSLGLEESQYGALFFKKPDNSMKWQYDFLHSIIDRAESVVEWKESMEKSGSVETLGDVYEQKMDNLREFLKENGRADWIARNTYLVNKNILVYFVNLILAVLVISAAISWLVFSSLDP